VIIRPTLQSPSEVKSPPGRRCSIALHRKRLDAAGHEHSSTREAGHAPHQLITSDIDEETDDDDDDEVYDEKKSGGRAQFAYDVRSVFCQPSLATLSAQREQTSEPTIINSFYDFVSR